MQLLQFPLVGMIGKVRLALSVLRCARMRDWKPLEAISVEEWLINMCGRRTYENFWKPFLLAMSSAFVQPAIPPRNANSWVMSQGATYSLKQ
jgi:hypothetical protein